MPLAGAGVVMIGAGLVMFDSQVYNNGPPVAAQVIRITILAIGFPLLALVLYCHLRRDLVPDLLRTTCHRPFEVDGLCFALTIDTIDDVAFIRLNFQNRYERPCVALIRMIAHETQMPENKLEIACEGAEFGVLTRPIVIPLSLQNRRMEFDILATNTYPDGRGRMLRFRDGFPVGNLDRKQRDLRTFLFAMMGQIHITMPARCTLQLPNAVRPPNAEDDRTDVKSLWLPQ